MAKKQEFNPAESLMVALQTVPKQDFTDDTFDLGGDSPSPVMEEAESPSSTSVQPGKKTVKERKKREPRSADQPGGEQSRNTLYKPKQLRVSTISRLDTMKVFMELTTGRKYSSSDALEAMIDAFESAMSEDDRKAYRIITRMSSE